MARGKPLTVTLYYNGVQVETLPEEAKNNISERLTRAMSTYYTAHPDQYRALCEADEKREQTTHS